MRQTDVLIFRHGETDWNREQRFQGHTDIPLNETGRAQARQLTATLKQLRPHAILTSDLSRARETAEIANSVLKIPIYITPDLRECRLGDPEGMLRSQIASTYGVDTWEKWLSVKVEDLDFCFPNGENKRQHLQRITHYVESFAKTNPQFSTLALSTHGGSLRRLVHHCKGAPIEPVPLPNCALYKLSFHHHSGEWFFHQALPDQAPLSETGSVFS